MEYICSECGACIGGMGWCVDDPNHSGSEPAAGKRLRAQLAEKDAEIAKLTAQVEALVAHVRNMHEAFADEMMPMGSKAEGSKSALEALGVDLDAPQRESGEEA